MGAAIRPAFGNASTAVIRNVQALRAIAALLVVVVHIGDPHGFEVRYMHATQPLLGASSAIGHTGVDLFFVISGFIMTVTTLRHHHLPSSLKFLALRIIRIYPLYWIITGLVLAVWLWRPDLVNSHSTFPPDIIASFLALPQRGSPLLLVGWSLVYEMYFYAIFALALALGRRFFVPVIAAWALATLGFNLGFGSSSNPWLHTIASPVCYEFVLGIAVGGLVLSRTYGIPVLWLAIGATGFAVECAIGFGSGWGAVLSAIPLAFVLYGAVGLELECRIVFPKALDALGDASYATYLCHVPVLAIIGVIVAHVFPSGGSRTIDAIVVVAGIVIVQTTALAIHRYIERPLIDSLRAAVTEPGRTIALSKLT